MQIAEAKDTVSLDSGHHRVKLSSCGHILADNAATCLSKAQSKQVTNLENRSLEHNSLILALLVDLPLGQLLVLLFFFVVDMAQGSNLVQLLTCCDERILSNRFDLFYHPFKRVKY